MPKMTEEYKESFTKYLQQLDTETKEWSRKLAEYLKEVRKK